MGKLRECMKRDMEIRGFSPSTQQAYLHQVKALARYFGRAPDALTLEDIHTYQLHLTRERKIASSSLTQAVAALRFFYGVTCKKDWDIEQIPYPKRKRRLPVVFNQTELLRLFDAVENFKHRTILMTLYAAGLRVSEVVHLRISDIDSQRMMIFIRQGKGRQDRLCLPFITSGAFQGPVAPVFQRVGHYRELETASDELSVRRLRTSPGQHNTDRRRTNARVRRV